MNRSHPAPEPSEREQPDEKSFIDHLEELRWTIIRVLLVFLCAFACCIPLTLRGYTINLLTRPLAAATGRTGSGSPGIVLPTLYPAGGFAVAMKVSLELALVLSLPLVLYFVGLFLLPALTRRERRYFVPALLYGALLFYAGAAFCYFTVLPWALRFFWDFNRFLGIENLWTINEYISFASRTLIAFGLVFELPLVILFLVAVGLLNYRMLSEKRRYAIVAAFIVAAVLTPGPDAVSQICMTIPLLLLYEICVWGARAMEIRRAAGRNGDAANREG